MINVMMLVQKKIRSLIARVCNLVMASRPARVGNLYNFHKLIVVMVDSLRRRGSLIYMSYMGRSHSL